MMKRLAFLAALGLAVPTAQAGTTADYFRARAERANVPQVLSTEERVFYSALFAALAREDWPGAEAMFAQRPDGPLHAVARAELYLAANSPKVELPPLMALLSAAPALPQAEQIARLAARRGATELPSLPAPQRMISQPGAPKRVRPSGIADGTMPSAVSEAILERIRNDDPMGARLLLDGVDATLSPAARAEWRQRVGWSFYIENDDASALGMAIAATEGSGPWVSEGWWTAGLANWRMGDCLAAAGAFERAGSQAHNVELAAAAHYWASRAHLKCRAPDKVTAALRLAARHDETFYGLLAREALGMRDASAAPTPHFSAADWRLVADQPNVRAAVALTEIGQDDLAGQFIRHQARIGPAGHYGALARLARDVGLPNTQLWLAHNAPRGQVPDDDARYPSPPWLPPGGWRVDPALAYAHALQESNFRAEAVSGAGAAGLMQIMPITVRQHAASLGLPTTVDIKAPHINLAFGQRNLEQLRDSGVTGGLLPKVMAAYNAGLTPVSRWNSEIRDGGDPLLWMESIPYWETRGYVGIVMRNYWMYEAQADASSASRSGLAQNKWPRFPGTQGAASVRLTPRSPVHGD